MELKTIKEIPEIKGKKILIRVDFNVPMTDDDDIQDDTRMTEALPTLKYLKDKGAKLIIMTHLGRPDGEVKEELRVTKIAKHLEKLMKCDVLKMDEVIGDKVNKTVEEMKNGDLLMLENTRFMKEEEENDEKFSKQLASLADYYVNDAFGTAHRAHASTEGVSHFLESFAGFLIEKEIAALSPLVEGEPDRPLALILGGAKIDTKIAVIEKFMEKSDYVLLGGGLANTFLLAAGYNIGGSLCQKDKAELAREIMLEFEKHHERFTLPMDAVVTDEIKEGSQTINIPIQDITGNMKIGDIGKWTIEKYCTIIKECATVIWNGPVGVSEINEFSEGTKAIANCIANHNCDSIIGGGDTADALKRHGFTNNQFTHISTGGGACIEFLEGKTLPGIKALLK